MKMIDAKDTRHGAMSREIECKLDVPATTNEYELLFSCCLLASGRGCTSEPVHEKIRRFTYYDTPLCAFYKNGWTARMVEGFDAKTSQGTHRYDIKVGPLQERYETSLWSNRREDITTFMKKSLVRLGIHNELRPSAMLTMKTLACMLTKTATSIEATLDTCVIDGGTTFRELELELKRGEREHLEQLCSLFERTFHLPLIFEQKYSRVMRLLGGKKT